MPETRRHREHQLRHHERHNDNVNTNPPPVVLTGDVAVPLTPNVAQQA
jgi:hypothetical protein